ncbi:uncharacterized protein [Palaemon carinicauda]|uniref:uncharacterized protein n=1 Tax=Palaemon carinicauda TaxID=392227 RepID=UPI0035B617CB
MGDYYDDNDYYYYDDDDDYFYDYYDDDDYSDNDDYGDNDDYYYVDDDDYYGEDDDDYESTGGLKNEAIPQALQTRAQYYTYTKISHLSCDRRKVICIKEYESRHQRHGLNLACDRNPACLEPQDLGWSLEDSSEGWSRSRSIVDVVQTLIAIPSALKDKIMGHGSKDTRRGLEEGVERNGEGDVLLKDLDGRRRERRGGGGGGGRGGGGKEVMTKDLIRGREAWSIEGKFTSFGRSRRNQSTEKQRPMHHGDVWKRRKREEKGEGEEEEEENKEEGEEEEEKEEEEAY